MLKTLFVKFVEKFYQPKVFELGKGKVLRYTLIEIKWLFSVYLHNIDTSCQDRFHTHAFDAWIYCLSGGYIDLIKSNIGDKLVSETKNIYPGLWRFVPRLLNHCLTKAEPNTYTLLFTGPWCTLWTEEFEDGRIDLLTSGRKIIKTVKVVN